MTKTELEILNTQIQINQQMITSCLIENISLENKIKIVTLLKLPDVEIITETANKMIEVNNLILAYCQKKIKSGQN